MHPRETARNRKPAWTLLAVVVASGVSVVGLVEARGTDSEFLFLLLAITVLSGLSLTIGWIVYRWVDGRGTATRESPQTLRHSRHTTIGDYTAKYPLFDRIFAAVVATMFVVLSGWIYRTSLWAALLSLGGSIVMISYAIHLSWTRVRFLDHQVVAQKLFRRTIAASYNSIERISSGPSVVTLHLSDGRSVRLHPGLGNAERIVGLLQSRCKAVVLI